MQKMAAALKLSRNQRTLMKRLQSGILFIFLYYVAYPQQNNNNNSELARTNFEKLDSLEKVLPQVKDAVPRAMLLSELANAYSFREAEKGLLYGREGLRLSQKIDYENGIAFNKMALGSALWALGNYDNALQYSVDALQDFERLGNKSQIAYCYVLQSIINRDVGDYETALKHSYKSLALMQQHGLSARIPYANIGSIYELQNRLDSASYFTLLAHKLDLRDNKGEWDWIYWILGNIEAKKANYPMALSHYRKALGLALKTNIYKTIVESHTGIAHAYRQTGNLDSCIKHASEVIQNWQFVSYQKGVLEAARILADAYKTKKQPDSAIKYLELSVTLNDKLFNQQLVRNIQGLSFTEQLRSESIERERRDFRQKMNMYILLGAGVLLLAIALFLWRSNQHRKRAYARLQQQKTETDIQKAKTEQALKDLKETQQQLIHSEKMASLGELTAGIAHEIQNPLNFVNNFSELNKELIAELRQEIIAGRPETANSIVTDIEANEEKINQHGRRADAIVKGMLQHSRTGSAQKEPTDINTLADEYLRLAYHGLRAKDKSFNARFETAFDTSIGKISVVPQDIGRVLLNLINNAFYSVTEKRKHQPTGYDPVVTIRTRKLPGMIELTVSDNGMGIPSPVIEKIFQPFFTTKPTGQGTGLGLSLSYDIVTNGHGGLMKAETREGEYATFIIQLPI